MSALGRLRWTVIGLVAIATFGCGGGTTELARVGDRQLEIVPFQDYVADVTGETWQGVSAVVTSRLMDQYLERVVVIEAAKKADIHAPEQSVELVPNEVQWLLDELCGLPPDPTSEAIATEVERRLEVTRPTRAHVRQVLVDSHDEAIRARERLVAGEEFVVISREMSRAPNAADGGELGLFDQGSLTPEIDEVIFSLQPGEYSDPVQGPSGFHVFQVLEVVPSGPPDRLQIESDVRTELAQDGARRHTRECIDSLASDVGVEINTVNLWFPYSGRYLEEEKDA